jgi:hypothetical protein
MHGDGFEVDADRLATQAGQFAPLVDRLGAIHRGLADALTADGTCWGTDAVGQSFASVHTGPADDTATRLSVLSERLGSVGTRLGDTAAAYGTGDESAAAQLNAAEH